MNKTEFSEAEICDDTAFNLCNSLKAVRTEKKISQVQLAEMVGVSRQTISSIENNQFCPSARLALMICIALKKNFEELFYFEM